MISQLCMSEVTVSKQSVYSYAGKVDNCMPHRQYYWYFSNYILHQESKQIEADMAKINESIRTNMQAAWLTKNMTAFNRYFGL